jgi:septum formation protein
VPRLVLASQSPRRRELLAGLGFELDVRPANADETQRPGETPAEYVLRVARDKARAVPGDVVLGADTAVVVKGTVLGKPADPADARRMLRTLSGEAHEVLTGVCVRRNAGALGVELDTVVTTEVRFSRLTSSQIEWYVSTGEPLDKAGAYALQGAGGVFVEAVEGSVSNVIGLPLGETLQLLRRAGLPLPWESP